LQLVDLIKREAVFFRFETGDKEAILDEMIRTGCAAEGIDCLDEVHRAVFEREADRSTGIGRGLAVPHCRADGVRRFHVSFVFLVIGPADQPEAYLQLLSQISRLIRLPQATKRLLAATTPEEVISTIGDL
jgi:mannitol/fructose-specific phosphotransferase system IIA component (Ntr-type)